MDISHLQIPQSKPLYEQVVELLEARIMDGDFRVGDKLPTENELASMYMVSRTVVREAIKALRAKGWVETHPGKGTFVVSNIARGVDTSFDSAVRMSPDGGWGHLIEVRQMLEPEIAALAAIRANEEQLSKMRQAVEQMDRTLAEEPQDIHKFLEADFAFHMSMAEATGNPLVLMILNPVVKLMRDLQRYHYSRVKGGGKRSQQNHKLILESVQNRDPESARLHMRMHIQQVREDVEGSGEELRTIR